MQTVSQHGLRLFHSEALMAVASTAAEARATWTALQAAAP
jgi:hypothetical protein